MKVGFIGLGAVGFPIAAHIIRQGYPLLFFARRPEVIRSVSAIGGEYVPSITQLGEAIKTVILFVNTFEQCQSCIQDLLITMREGTIIVGSTISPMQSRALEAMCAARGVQLIDAPVSGGVQGAKDATLTMMVSGNEELIKQLNPLFRCYSQKIVNVGTQTGSAQALKAVNQMLVGINIVAVCEAYNFGMKCGLDPCVIFDVVSASAGTSRIFENRSEHIIARNFDKRSSLSIQQKDLEICESIAEDANITLYLTKACTELYAQAGKAYNPDEDSIAVIKLMESMDGQYRSTKNEM